MKAIVNIILACLSLYFVYMFIQPVRPHRHVPTETQQCASHMKGLGFAQLMYAEDHNDLFCSDPCDLKPYYPEGNSGPYVCPIVQRNVRANMQTRQQGAYVIVKDLTVKSAATSVLAYCPPENHTVNKAVVLFVDCHIEFKDEETFLKLLDEQNIDYIQ